MTTRKQPPARSRLSPSLLSRRERAPTSKPTARGIPCTGPLSPAVGPSFLDVCIEERDRRLARAGRVVLVAFAVVNVWLCWVIWRMA